MGNQHNKEVQSDGEKELNDEPENNINPEEELSLSKKQRVTHTYNEKELRKQIYIKSRMKHAGNRHKRVQVGEECTQKGFSFALFDKNANPSYCFSKSVWCPRCGRYCQTQEEHNTLMGR